MRRSAGWTCGALLLFFAASAMAGEIPSESTGTGRPTTVTADRLVVSRKERRAVYTGNVVATTTDLTVTADRMEFEFDEKMEAVEQMVAIGNVQISRSDGTRAMSEQATYDVLQDRLMLEGKERGRVTAVIYPKQQPEQAR